MTVTDFFAGEIVTELLKQLLKLSRKSCMCKSIAESFHASISQNLPIIQEIKHSGVELSEFRQTQLDRFSETLREGLDLANTAIRSKPYNLYKNFVLARKMEKISRAVDQFLQGPIQVHILADVHANKFANDERFDRVDRNFDRNGQKLDEVFRILTMGSRSGASKMVEDEAAATISAAEAMEAATPGVGMEFAVRKVKEMVIERDDLTVVGVRGIGGSGKTTLVREIIRDENVRLFFKDRILFLTVSQSPDVEHLRSRIWAFLTRNGDGLMNPNYVVPQLNLNHPMGVAGPAVRRLVVLDDVWSLAHLERLVIRIPGCKTLVTSRISFPTVVNTNAAHEMALLTEDQAVSLFCLSAFGQLSIPPMADHNLVQQIVSECKRLPLALKVIGASLRDDSEMIWKAAAKRLSRGETIGQSHETHLLDRMAISVNSLSEKVRDCFLDLGAFPEDRKIPLGCLVTIWAELHHIDPEEAFAIVVELANKNLLTLHKDSSFRDAYCSYYDIAVTQHDVLRDLALHLSRCEPDRTRLFMARRESEPPKEWEKHSHRPFNARIVSIHTGEMHEMDWFQMDLPKAEVLILNFSAEDFFLPPFLETMPNLRALVIVNHHSTTATLRNFPELPTLQSLWLERVSVPQLSSAAAKLRKLSIFQCKVNAVDQDLSAEAFQSLSELTIDDCDDLLDLPKSLCELRRLDSLSVTNCHALRALPAELGRARSLRILRLTGCPELRELPASLPELRRVEYLDVSRCLRLAGLPRGIEKMERLEKIDMRDCSRFSRLPVFSAPARSLRRVICDDDVAWRWQAAKKWVPNAFVLVPEKHYSLDWLDD